MKYLIFILIISLAACSNKPVQHQQICNHDACNFKADSLQKAKDSLLHRFAVISDKYTHVLDSVIIENTKLSAQNIELRNDLYSVKTKLFNSNYRLLRIKEYIRICMRNPSQDKFLKGWVRRVIEL